MSSPGVDRSAVGALATDGLVAALPLLASVAIYLPSGIAMPFRLATFALIALAIWHRISTRRVSAPRTLGWLGAIVGCIVVFGVIGSMRFPTRFRAEDAVRTGFLLALCLAIAVVAVRRRTIVWLMWGWMAAAVVSAAPALWEVATGRHLPKHSSATLATTVPGWNIIASFFDNPNLYAYQCAVVLLLTPLVFFTLPARWRWAVLPLAALVGYLTLWTQGRIAVLAVVVGFGVWALRSRVGRWAALGTLALSGIAWLLRWPFAVAVRAQIDNAIIEASQPGASTWVRMQLARSAWWITKQTGLVGTGPGGFASWGLDPANPFVYEKLNNAHSGMAEVLVDFGIVTLAVVLASLVVAAVVSVVRASKVRAGSLEGVALYAPAVLALTLPLVSASHSTWLQQPLSAAHLATIVALLAWGEARRMSPS